MDPTLARLAEVPNLTVLRDAPLAEHTRFAIGGPADIYVETGSVEAFIQALGVARESGSEYMVIGGGTNLVVSDSGYRGIMLRLVARRIMRADDRVYCEAGAVLQDLVDFAIEQGLRGIETLAGIPGSVGAAVYGNAGAYGHSISERVLQVRFFDGEWVRFFDREACEFHYRESVFKRRKEWVIFSTELRLERAQTAKLRKVADDILKVRNEKFPVTMKCAGSIFKNLVYAELPPAVAARVPENVVREGKVPAAYFLEQAGAKGVTRGEIHVAAYHANLIYNGGHGTAADLRGLIQELKEKVRHQFGLELEEEVQYVGFADAFRVG
jgi:UDP-N-acetylmuramate dehydrogenase